MYDKFITYPDGFSGLYSYQTQPVPVPVPASDPPPVTCPKCQAPFKRNQELRRHIVSCHLPDSIYCPYPSCSWRGRRKESFQKHLEVRKCGPKPEQGVYEIYVTDLVLDWILEGTSVETAAVYAVDFVAERAYELGKEEEWQNLWGDGGKRSRRAA